MKTVEHIRGLIADKPKEEVLFMPFFDKNQADEWLEENDTTELTSEEWLYVVNGMENDETLWTEIINTWNFYIDKAISKRKEG